MPCLERVAVSLVHNIAPEGRLHDAVRQVAVLDLRSLPGAVQWTRLRTLVRVSDEGEKPFVVLQVKANILSPDLLAEVHPRIGIELSRVLRRLVSLVVTLPLIKWQWKEKATIRRVFRGISNRCPNGSAARTLRSLKASTARSGVQWYCWIGTPST